MQLDVRLDGFDDPFGQLSSDDRGAARAAYSEHLVVAGVQLCHGSIKGSCHRSGHLPTCSF